MSDLAEQPGFFDAITVHCFLRCGHVVIANDPDEAHNDMEQHYASAHVNEIARIVGVLR